MRSKAEKKSRAALSVQEDEAGNQEKVAIADQAQGGVVPLQDGGSKPANAQGARGGGVSVTGKSGDTEDSLALLDAAIVTSEEDSSCLLDQEMALARKEGEQMGPGEMPCSDGTSSPCRPSSLRKGR